MKSTFKRLAVLSAGAALFTLPLTALNPALAACAPDNPAAGGTVTCSAVDNDGFSDNDDNLTVNVLSGAQVNNPGGNGIEVGGNNSQISNSGIIDADIDGIRAGDDSRINNSGTITTDDDGIVARGNAQITNSGTITVDDSGIDAGDDSHITNSGTIIADGYGIEAGDNSQITNSGAITSQNDDGISARDDWKITNSGTIIADGYGINARENAQIINSGTITSKFNDGILANDNAQITNSGTITSQFGSGIDAGDDAQITNSGTIASQIEVGIRVDDNSQITNSGMITAGDDGIQTGSNNIITNSGSIINSNGPSGTAISLSGGVNVVNLLAGSVLVGTVRPGIGVDTLNLGAGLDAIVMVTGTQFEFINFGSRLGVVSGLTVYQADTTAQEQTDDALADIASGVGQTVLDRISSAFGDDVPTDSTSGYAALTKQSTSETAIETAVSGYGDKNERNYWASLWGSASNGEAAGGVDANLRHGGYVSGVDWMTDGNLMGFFSGGSLSKISADIKNGQSTEIKSYYGGGYGRWTKGNMYIDAVVSGGVMSFSSERWVANNLILGGLEKAKADYLGYYIAPTVTFSSVDGLQGTELMPSLTLGYAGLFLDGFTESGSMANLTVEDRNIHVATARFQLALDKEFIDEDGSMTKVRPYFGVEAKAGFGDADQLKVTLANQALSVSLGGDDVVYRGGWRRHI